MPRFSMAVVRLRGEEVALLPMDASFYSALLKVELILSPLEQNRK